MAGQPTYLYKLIPASRPDLLPLPIPNALPLNDRDTQDNFIHLSTEAQVRLVTQNHLANETEVFVLRLEYGIVEPRIIWQNGAGTAPAVMGAVGAYGHFHPEGGAPLAFGNGQVEGIFFLRRAGAAWAAADFNKNWLIY